MISYIWEGFKYTITAVVIIVGIISGFVVLVMIGPWIYDWTGKAWLSYLVITIELITAASMWIGFLCYCSDNSNDSGFPGS